MGNLARIAPVLLLSVASIASADVIPADYVPPPPPECAVGAQPMTNRGPGHGAWGPCIASTCASDADCGALGPCREAALCVGAEIQDRGPREPGAERPSYRIAPLACPADGACPSPYECVTAMRCVGRPAPPPPSTPTTTPSTTPSSTPAPASPPEPRSGWCSVAQGERAVGAPLALVLALVITCWRRACARGRRRRSSAGARS